MKPALKTLLDSEPQDDVFFRAVVARLATEPLPRDAELELSNAERTKLVDAELDRFKQQDEAFFDAVVARMEKDEDFRRRVHKEVKRIGKGRRGGKAQNPALVRSIVDILGIGDDVKKGATKALAGTVGVKPRQARRLKAMLK